MPEKKKQILRLTTPELKNVRGPFRSESQRVLTELGER